MRKINVEYIAKYMDKFIDDEDNENIIVFWFNKKKRKIYEVDNLIKNYGGYSEELFIDDNWIPIDSVNILDELRETVEDFDYTLIEGFKDIRRYAAEWEDREKEDQIKRATEWLEKNNLPYRVKRRKKRQRRRQEFFMMKIVRSIKDKITARKIDLEFIACGMDVYVIDEDDQNMVAYWFNTISRKLEDRYRLTGLFGSYDEDIFKANNWIPMDSIDILKKKKEYVYNTGRTDLIGSIEGLEGEDLDGAINLIFHDNEDIADEFNEMHEKDQLVMAKSWLEKNNLPYRVNRKLKKYLESLII